MAKRGKAEEKLTEDAAKTVGETPEKDEAKTPGNHEKKPKAQSSHAKKSVSEENIHSGHRSRLRAEACEGGFRRMNPHRFLEYLLTYPIPRRDTNPLAHRVVNRFGGIGEAFSADIGELEEVDGLGETSAIFLNLCGKFYEEFGMKDPELPKPWSTEYSLINYLATIYDGSKPEVLLLYTYSDGRVFFVDRFEDDLRGDPIKLRQKIVKSYDSFRYPCAIIHCSSEKRVAEEESKIMEDIISRVDEGWDFLEASLFRENEIERHLMNGHVRRWRYPKFF